MAGKMPVVGISMPHEMIIMIDEAGEKANYSRAQIVRMAVTHYFKSNAFTEIGHQTPSRVKNALKVFTLIGSVLGSNKTKTDITIEYTDLITIFSNITAAKQAFDIAKALQQNVNANAEFFFNWDDLEESVNISFMVNTMSRKRLGAYRGNIEKRLKETDLMEIITMKYDMAELNGDGK